MGSRRYPQVFSAADILALVEVADAAQAALKTARVFGDITIPERVRLEEALSKLEEV